MSYYLGVDVGGSHVAAALVTKGRLLGEVSSTANTANTEDALIDLIIALVIPLLEGVQLQGVGLGVPGQVKAGRLVAASNLLYLREADLAGRVSAELGVPTMLFNDANCAVAAELLGADSRDAYLNSPTAALLTLGTGVGLGLFVQGRLHEGASGLVEGGHSIIAMGGRLCGCGQRGCAEAYASARSVVARYEEAGGHAVDAQEVFKRASQGDAAAVVVVEETGLAVAVLCINISRLLDPDVIVLGGGLALAGAPLLALVRRHVMQQAWTVLPAELNLALARAPANGGVLGAAMAACSSIPR